MTLSVISDQNLTRHSLQLRTIDMTFSLAVVLDHIGNFCRIRTLQTTIRILCVFCQNPVYLESQIPNPKKARRQM